MSTIDWIIAVLPFILVLYLGFRAQRLVSGVAGFLSGGRVAGRYLLAVAGMESSVSVISLIAACEQSYHSGFAFSFWSGIGILVTMAIALSGFVIYRYRETRAMTLAQFFELRYSKSFRIFTGGICFLSGILNYALFPVISTRFFIYYCNIPQQFQIGGVTFSTLGILMAFFLAVSLAILFLGGQLSCMLTDCLQGLFTYAIFTVLLIYLLLHFTPEHYETVLLNRPDGASFINPFDTAELTDFNILFILIGVFMSAYGKMAWQGAAGYNSAAKSAHEQKMASMLITWREGLGRMKIPLLVMSALILLNHPDFSDIAAQIREALSGRIADGPGSAAIRRQMTVPLALHMLLPTGLSGLFVALMFMAMVSTDTTCLQSWGSIFIQDLVLPLRKTQLNTRTHLWLLRLAILGVAAFAWCFGYFYRPDTFILHFFSMTGALWIGFAGSVIIGGLYWKFGNTCGAWAAAAVGLGLGSMGFWLQSCWSSSIYAWLSCHAPSLLENFSQSLESLGDFLRIARWQVTPERFPISGAEWGFLTAISCIIVYVTVSLATGRGRVFDLDALLHRPPRSERPARPRRSFAAMLGINANYTRGDRIQTYLVFAWNIYNFAVFLGIVIWNVYFFRWPEEWWFDYFYYYGFGLALLVGLVTTVWFSWGGIRDIRDLFRTLRTARDNPLDDGTVINHRNADETATPDSSK